MFEKVEITNAYDGSADPQLLNYADNNKLGRPFVVNSQGRRVPWDEFTYSKYPGGSVKIHAPNGLTVNSSLRKDEWERLDAAVLEAAAQRLQIVTDVIGLGFTQPIGNIGVMITQYNRSSQMTAAEVSMDGASQGQEDRVDFQLEGVPLPITHKSYRISARELAATRMSNSGVDTANAREAGRVVAEALETMMVDGDALTFNTENIYGFTNEPQRDTNTATGYGGGDWGTLSNVIPTISGVITQLIANNYRGPYGVYAHPTQYNQSATAYFTDGSGDTGADRIERLTQVQFYRPADFLAAGEVVVWHLSADVMDVAGMNLGPVDSMIQNVEWVSPDGSTNYFKVFAVMVPRAKRDYSNNSGIGHVTSA